ncbi:MAG: hypothetical protein NZ891_02775, partial [bacterium]|nr:hypothetical protein [bacterium]MDW8163648.1 uroporphyrinogen decarboxylase family protein [Candidatus Omnitrophota bacterium]
IEVGLDCLQPLEVKAGMDLIELKEKYGDKIAFMGGIDTRLMSDPDPSKIEEEIKKKFEVAKKNGGYIYHSDHSIPNTVSFQQYCYVIELVKKYGIYPEYEEIEKQEREKITVKEEVKVETPIKKEKKGFFGKKEKEKRKEKPSVVEKKEEIEVKKEKKKFSLFGKKKQ